MGANLGCASLSKMVVISVLVLDIVAFVLSVIAEHRRTTVHTITDPGINYEYCRYDSDNVATGYGLGAFFCLLGSQLVVMASTRCLCCGKGLNPGGSRACAVILFIFCWLTFIIAEACLLAASARNVYHKKFWAFIGDHPPSCETLGKGVFAAGAAFIFFTAILSEFYYIFYSKARPLAPVHSHTAYTQCVDFSDDRKNSQVLQNGP